VPRVWTAVDVVEGLVIMRHQRWFDMHTRLWWWRAVVLAVAVVCILWWLLGCAGVYVDPATGRTVSCNRALAIDRTLCVQGAIASGMVLKE
jgi:hypothetical protein